MTPYEHSQFPDIDAQVAADSKPGIVAVTAAGAQVTRERLEAKGGTLKDAEVAEYTIFWDVTPPRLGR